MCASPANPSQEEPVLTFPRFAHQLRNAVAPIGTFLRMVDTAEASEEIQALHAAARRCHDRILALLKEAP